MPNTQCYENEKTIFSFENQWNITFTSDIHKRFNTIDTNYKLCKVPQRPRTTEKHCSHIQHHTQNPSNLDSWLYICILCIYIWFDVKCLYLFIFSHLFLLQRSDNQKIFIFVWLLVTIDVSMVWLLLLPIAHAHRGHFTTFWDWLTAKLYRVLSFANFVSLSHTHTHTSQWWNTNRKQKIVSSASSAVSWWFFFFVLLPLN